LPALALGVDSSPEDPMRRPPDKSSGLLSAVHLRRAVVAALVLASMVLCSGRIGQSLGWDPTMIRTELLLCLLAVHLVLAYVVRASRWTFERGWAAGRGLRWAILGSLGAQLMVFCTPLGRSMLDLATLPALGWAIAAASVVVVVAVFDIARLLTRSRSRRLEAPA
jgi:Ca2+-transporting ATPase